MEQHEQECKRAGPCGLDISQSGKGQTKKGFQALFYEAVSFLLGSFRNADERCPALLNQPPC